MSKVSTNISIDANLKKESVILFKDLGMDLSTAVTLFLKQCQRVQGIPFPIKRDNKETLAALNEYDEMQKHPEKYKKYSSFKDAMNEILDDEI